MWKTPTASSKGPKKQVRKPISSNFSPKRLAINFQPPTIILEYLVIDTDASRLCASQTQSYKTDDIRLCKNETSSDQQILKFIDRILVKLGKSKQQLEKIMQKRDHLEASPEVEEENQENDQGQGDNQDDFDYLNDDEQYEEDYEDYEQDHLPVPQNNKENNTNKTLPQSSFTTKQTVIWMNSKIEPSSQPSSSLNQNNNSNKNTFMTYCQQEYDDENEQEQQANWDLDIDENADFDFV